MKILGIIPARYASTRFPGKPLADINGKSMIQRVMEQAQSAQCIDQAVVATDDQRIYDHVKQFGGTVAMTSEDHQSGTDRCFEALGKQSSSFDYVINIQGDEPFIQPEQIDLLGSLLDGNTEIATLIKPIENEDQLFDPNTVKAVNAANGSALYFSRNPIPFARGVEKGSWLEKNNYFKHIGIYAYRTDILKEITSLKQSSLERAESLEQLRWLENGYSIKTATTQHESIGIDTPEDLKKVLSQMNK